MLGLRYQLIINKAIKLTTTPYWIAPCKTYYTLSLDCTSTPDFLPLTEIVWWLNLLRLPNSSEVFLCSMLIIIIYLSIPGHCLFEKLGCLFSVPLCCSYCLPVFSLPLSQSRYVLPLKIFNSIRCGINIYNYMVKCKCHWCSYLFCFSCLELFHLLGVGLLSVAG